MCGVYLQRLLLWGQFTLFERKFWTRDRKKANKSFTKCLYSITHFSDPTLFIFIFVYYLRLFLGCFFFKSCVSVCRERWQQSLGSCQQKQISTLLQCKLVLHKKITVKMCGHTTHDYEWNWFGNIQLKSISHTCLWRGVRILCVSNKDDCVLIQGLNQDPEVNFEEATKLHRATLL